MAQLKVERPRPRRLSDPHDEFGATGPDCLLAVPDAQLQWHHYRKLLGPFKPAGTYEEVSYFLPLAFDHIIAHDDDALDLVTSLVWFVSEYDEELREDRLCNAARDRIRDCLSHWASEFRIIHFDLEACRAKGWVIPYEDLVLFSEVVCQCTEDLVRFKNHADLALEFFQSLVSHGNNSAKSAWFLELARACDDVYTPPDDPAVRALLLDRELIVSAASIIRKERVEFGASPTYWNDTFRALNV